MGSRLAQLQSVASSIRSKEHDAELNERTNHFETLRKTLGIDTYERDLKRDERDDLAQVFGRWFEHSRAQKAKWKNMVRFRYLLSRTKLNRITLAWKVHVRKIKVRRLQYTIGSHQHYKRVLRECVGEWRLSILRQKEFRERIEHVLRRHSEQYLAEAFDAMKDESRRVLIIAKKGDRVAEQHPIWEKRRIFNALYEYRAQRYQVAFNRLQADKLRDRLLQLVYFRAIHRFSKLKDRKVAAIRTVNQHL